MKRKTELLMNFIWIKKISILMMEMLQKEIQSLCNFFLKIVKIEHANKVQSSKFKVQSFFSKKDAFSALRTSLFISFTSLIGME
jgi:hypothetical protein